MFQRKVAVASVAVQPEDIPPTSAAVKFHSRRTYHQVSIFLTYIYCNIFKYKQILCWPNIHYIFIMIQVQNWLGNDKIDAVQWGWELRDIMLVPTLTDLPPAPQDLLKIIKCSCMGSCDTLRCTCQKKTALIAVFHVKIARELVARIPKLSRRMIVTLKNEIRTQYII